MFKFFGFLFKADNGVVRGNLGDSKNVTGGELNQTTGGAEKNSPVQKTS